MLKNKYKDDYSRFLRMNGKGRVVPDICYTGDYYILPFEESQKKKTAWVNLFFSVLLFAIQLFAGMLNQDSSRTFWIVYPYMFVFLPVAYMFLGAVTYFGVPHKMQKAHYETSLMRLRHSCVGAMILVGISGLLDIVYIIRNRGSIRMGMELCYLFLHVLFLLMAVLYGKYYDRTYGGIHLEKSKNLLE